MIDSRFNWLTDEFVLNLVKKVSPNGEVTVDSATTESALPKGENFGSNITRINVRFHDEFGKAQNVSFIHKSALISEVDEKLAEQYDVFTKFVFRNEIETYCHLLPKINEVIASLDASENVSSIAPQ